MQKEALHKIGYGVYIVSSRSGDKFNGQIANAIFQITAEPPTIAISINKQNLTHEFISNSKVFSVSILVKDTPLKFIGDFGFKSGRQGNKFEGVTFKTGKVGAPIVLDNTLAYLEAELIDQLEVGTHTVFVGKVVDAEILKPGEPMTYAYYHDVKKGTSPKSAPTYLKEEDSRIKKEDVGKMQKYVCKVCGYVYDPKDGDPDNGIKPDTAFESLPDTWVCPICNAAKDQFEKVS